MSGSAIVIKLNGVDITSRAIFATASFESLANAQPGTCEITCRDPAQNFNPVTGQEILLEVDGVRLWGGYLMQVSRTHPFDADSVPVVSADYTKRYWVLRGSDFNILFDKRILRKTTNYVESLPLIAGTTMDGTAIEFLMANYIDVPAGFNTTTYVDNNIEVSANLSLEPDWSYQAQGSTLRVQMEDMTKRIGAVYYFDANKYLHWHALEAVESRWGFSDQPNYASITASPASYQGALWGFREVEGNEDGTALVNDALVWGGSEWGNAGVKFARVQDATSITDHGRWQVGETHFGESGYGLVAGPLARANVIVKGPPGVGVGIGGAYEQKGMRYSQWSFRFVWHDKDIPEIIGVKDYLHPGDLVTIELETFGVTKLLPLRSLRMTFPESKVDGTTYVRFDGNFGIQLSDPFTLWRYLIKNQKRIASTSIATASNSSTSVPYGALYQGEPTPTPDGAEVVFTTPFGYISGTTEVYLDGLHQRRGIEYTESSPEAGEITFVVAPTGGSEVWVISRTLSG